MTDTAGARRRSGGGLLAAAIAVGALAGMGGYTLDYGEGLSYLSAEPAACANCHIMQAQYDSWQTASHHTVATCVDCHLPAGFLSRYRAKAENGFHHSRGFTFQDFTEPIAIKEGNGRILQANCQRCHGPMTQEMLVSPGGDGPSCVHCHATVGHGVRAGLGGPETAAERQRGEQRR